MSIYCTYNTIYTGDKMPPFYIGYTTVDKIKNGYHGSVASKKYKFIWKEELKNNPHLFETTIIDVYDTKEEAVAAERTLLESVQAHKNPLYVNMSIGGRYFYTSTKYLNRKEYLQDYKSKNKEKIRTRQQEYKSKNKEKFLTYWQEHYSKNKEKNCAYQHEYKSKNKEKILEYGKNYYKNNKDKSQEYRILNKEKILRYRQLNIERRRERDREYYQRNKEARK